MLPILLGWAVLLVAAFGLMNRQSLVYTYARLTGKLSAPWRRWHATAPPLGPTHGTPDSSAPQRVVTAALLRVLGRLQQTRARLGSMAPDRRPTDAVPLHRNVHQSLDADAPCAQREEIRAMQAMRWVSCHAANVVDEGFAVDMEAALDAERRHLHRMAEEDILRHAQRGGPNRSVGP